MILEEIKKVASFGCIYMNYNILVNVFILKIYSSFCCQIRFQTVKFTVGISDRNLNTTT